MQDIASLLPPTKLFKEQVEMFVNAIEESAKNCPVHMPVAAREIKGESDALKPLTVRGETVSNTMKRKFFGEWWNRNHRGRTP